MLSITGISGFSFNFLIKKPYYLEKKYHALMSVVFNIFRIFIICVHRSFLSHRHHRFRHQSYGLEPDLGC
jgi:hypothetical protein